MATKRVDQVLGTLQTTGNNATTLATYAVPTASVISMRAHVIAAAAGVANSGASYYILAAAKEGGGTTSMISTSVQIVAEREDSNAAAYTADIVINGSNMLVRVTGAVGINVDWLAHGDVIAYTP